MSDQWRPVGENSYRDQAGDARSRGGRGVRDEQYEIYEHRDYQQPGNFDWDDRAAGYTEPDYAEPDYDGHSAESGYADSGYADSGYADTGYRESKFARARYDERGYRVSGYGEFGDGSDYGDSEDGFRPRSAPTSRDVPSYANETHIISAVGDNPSRPQRSASPRGPQSAPPRMSEPVSAEPTADSSFDEPAPDRASPQAVGASSRGTRRQARRRRQAGNRRRSRGKWIGSFAAIMVLVVLGGLIFVGGKMFLGDEAPSADYAGPGGSPVIIEVEPGDTAEQIAQSMADQDVVASSNAFYRAALQNSAMSGVQPGFYQLTSRIPAAQAVSELVGPRARVGHVMISPGRQLHDSRDVQTDAVKKGIYTLISEASCLGAPDAQRCISYDELNVAGAGILADLGVPDWAAQEVANVPDRNRQLEGLIAAGSWDFDPTSDATAILRKLVTQSAAAYEETGIRTAGELVGMSPYEVLISASLVEREAKPDDYAKVARVIVNRLAIGQPLQFDSTVNYALDTTELATTDADRAQVTPWNTYAMAGMPATPISAPSIPALRASESPEPGDWTYFVTIDEAGTTLFANSYEEHLANTRHALESGILSSGR